MPISPNANSREALPCPRGLSAWAASVADWSGMAESLFWLGRFGIQWPVAEWISDEDLKKILDSLPINVLGDVIIGLSYGYGNLFLSWLARHRITLVDRFRRETQTVVLEDDGQKLTIHFIVAIEQSVRASAG